MKSLSLVFLAALALAQEAKPRVDHVVIVSIDGLRPDAIDKAPAPTLQALIKQGAWCPKAQTIVPSITLPSHASMLTGLDIQRHGITWNDFRPGNIDHPTIFSEAKAAGRSTAMFFAKAKFHYLIRPGSVDFIYGSLPDNDADDPTTTAPELAKAFAKEWGAKRFALTFIHIREPDSAGHGQGWMGEDYLKAVVTSDHALGAIIEAIRKTGLWEKTALIVTADHGGSGRNHVENIPENTTIPWICTGPGVKAGLEIDRTVRTCDTAATALFLLGLPQTKGIQGKPVGEALPCPVQKNP